MQQFVVQSSDALPVKFTGELLAEVKAPENPPKFSRWHELRLYRTQSGKYVLEIVFGSNAKNSDGMLIEPGQNDVFVCETPEQVKEEVLNYDPMEFVVGYPEGVMDAKKKNERLRNTVVSQFQRNVGNLYMQAGKKCSEFVEEI